MSVTIYDRQYFFEKVRVQPFAGELMQGQVDGLNYLIDVWEENFASENREQWFAYCLATAFHETAATMKPIEEYGKGEGKDYGEPTGPYNQRYYGRGHVQLTWEENYMKAEDILDEKYEMDVPMHEYPHRMLEDEPSALVLYDGMIDGWFTGVGLPKFFNDEVEDPVNARQVVNGLDQAEKIASYYWAFKEALRVIEDPDAA